MNSSTVVWVPVKVRETESDREGQENDRVVAFFLPKVSCLRGFERDDGVGEVSLGFFSVLCS